MFVSCDKKTNVNNVKGAKRISWMSASSINTTRTEKETEQKTLYVQEKKHNKWNKKT